MMNSMEACFLSSNSFTKTLDLAPSRISTLSKKKFSHSCLTYCRLGSEDDLTPSISTDWRSFRARLVADERTSRIEEAANWVNPDIIEEDDQPAGSLVQIGDKWAHSLHEPERGCLLIATEKLDGVHIFERTVILILSTGPIGPTGIILNRPSLMSIKEIGSKVLDVAGTFSDSPLFFGGPLEEGLFLLGPKGGGENEGVSRAGPENLGAPSHPNFCALILIYPQIFTLRNYLIFCIQCQFFLEFRL